MYKLHRSSKIKLLLVLLIGDHNDGGGEAVGASLVAGGVGGVGGADLVVCGRGVGGVRVLIGGEVEVRVLLNLPLRDKLLVDEDRSTTNCAINTGSRPRP